MGLRDWIDEKKDDAGDVAGNAVGATVAPAAGLSDAAVDQFLESQPGVDSDGDDGDDGEDPPDSDLHVGNIPGVGLSLGGAVTKEVQSDLQTDPEDVETDPGNTGGTTDEQLAASMIAAREEGGISGTVDFIGSASRYTTSKTLGPVHEGVERATTEEGREHTQNVAQDTLRQTQKASELPGKPFKVAGDEYIGGEAGEVVESYGHAMSGTTRFIHDVTLVEGTRHIGGSAAGFDPLGQSPMFGQTEEGEPADLSGMFKQQITGESEGRTGFAGNAALGIFAAADVVGIGKFGRPLVRGANGNLRRAIPIGNGKYRAGEQVSDDVAQSVSRADETTQTANQADNTQQGSKSNMVLQSIGRNLARGVREGQAFYGAIRGGGRTVDDAATVRSTAPDSVDELSAVSDEVAGTTIGQGRRASRGPPESQLAETIDYSVGDVSQRGAVPSSRRIEGEGAVRVVDEPEEFDNVIDQAFSSQRRVSSGGEDNFFQETIETVEDVGDTSGVRQNRQIGSFGDIADELPGGATIADEPAAGTNARATQQTETAFQEQFPSGRENLTGQNARSASSEFGPMSPGAADEAIGAGTSGPDADDAGTFFGRTLADDTDEVTQSRFFDDLGDEGENAYVNQGKSAVDDVSGGSAADETEDVVEDLDEPPGFLGRVRQTLFGTRKRKAVTGLVGGGLALGTAGSYFDGAPDFMTPGDSRASGNILYQYEEEFEANGEVGTLISKVNAGSGETMGFIVFVGNRKAVASDATIRRTSVSLQTLAQWMDGKADELPSQLNTDFASSGEARRTFQQWAEQNASGGDSAPPRSDKWSGEVALPRSATPAEEDVTAEVTIRNATGNELTSDFILAVQADGSWLTMNRWSGTVESGGESREQFDVTQDLQVVAGEFGAGSYEVMAATAEGRQVSETVSTTSINLRTADGSGGDDGGWNESEIRQQLEGGWYLGRQTHSTEDRERWFVTGKTNSGRLVFLNAQGNAVEQKVFFESRERALQAHQQWLQAAQQGNASGPSPSPDAPRPTPQEVDNKAERGGLIGFLTNPMVMVAGAGIIGVWYLTDWNPIEWAKGVADDATDVISNIGR